MILCSCNVLTRKRIVAAAEALVAEDPTRPVTPGRIFKALGGRPQCGTCFPLIREMLADTGILITCPEPLASGAEEEEAATVSARIDVTFFVP